MLLADVQFSQGIEDAWSQVATFVPKLIGCIAILLIGYFIAKAISKAADRALERVGFDRAVERGGVKRMLARTEMDASDVVSKVILWGLMLIVLQAAFGVFGTNPVSDLIASVIAFVPNLLAAILILVVAAAVAAVVKEMIQATLERLSYGNAVANGVSIAIIVVGVFAALNQVEIAPEIVNGLFYATLAIIVGSAVIGIGGASIVPLRGYIERGLSNLDSETSKMRDASEGAGERIRNRADDLASTMRHETTSSSPQQGSS
jgi:hypothetical protein